VGLSNSVGVVPVERLHVGFKNNSPRVVEQNELLSGRTRNGFAKEAM
jgi:hypothetical protein